MCGDHRERKMLPGGQSISSAKSEDAWFSDIGSICFRYKLIDRNEYCADAGMCLHFLINCNIFNI